MSVSMRIWLLGLILAVILPLARAVEDEVRPPQDVRLNLRRRRKLIKISDLTKEEQHEESTRDKIFMKYLLEDTGFWMRELAASVSMTGMRRELDMSMSMMNVRRLPGDDLATPPNMALNPSDWKNSKETFLENTLKDTRWHERELEGMGSMSLFVGRTLDAFGSMSMDYRRLSQTDSSDMENGVEESKRSSERVNKLAKRNSFFEQELAMEVGAWTRELDAASMSVPLMS